MRDVMTMKRYKRNSIESYLGYYAVALTWLRASKQELDNFILGMGDKYLRSHHFEVRSVFDPLPLAASETQKLMFLQRQILDARAHYREMEERHNSYSNDSKL